MNLTGSRPWVVAGVLAALLITGLAWLLLIGPTRSDTASLREDTATVQTQNDVLMTKAAALAEQAEDRAGLEAEARGALAALPTDVALPDFSRQLAQQAAARGVSIVSVSVSAATAPTQTTTTGSDTVAADGLLAVPVTLEARGTSLALLYFLRDVQQVGPRSVLVDSSSLTTEPAEPTEPADPAGPTADPAAAVATTKLTTQLSVFAHALSADDATLLADVLGTTSDAG